MESALNQRWNKIRKSYILIPIFSCLTQTQLISSGKTRSKIQTITSASLQSLITEHDLWAKGYKHVIGVDEVGRGPLAGDVYAAAVCISPSSELLQVEDSKKLSEAKREQIFEKIKHDSSIYQSVFSVSSRRIDEINILQASLEAMEGAVLKLCVDHGLDFQDCYVVIDGNKGLKLPMKSKAVVRGDATVYSIAMASIIAKVERDKYMKEMEIMYPLYGFAAHKGYPTKAHVIAIHKYGPCCIHRMSFKPLKGRQ